MNNYFKYNLEESDKNRIIEFYNSFDNISINQFVGWEQINNPTKKICYFISFINNSVNSYAVIVENKKIAYVNYGPIAKKDKEIINAINKIVEYYRKKKFIKLIVKLGKPDNNTEIIQKHFNHQYKESNYPLNWSTLILKLKNTNIDDVFGKFSTNHKRSIKKAQKNKLTVSEISSLEQIKCFSEVYDNMYKSRKIVKSFNNTFNVFSNIYNLFKENNNGYFLGVFYNSKIIGGLILPKQGNTLYYQYGATDINYRKFPILHLAFYEAIKIAIAENFDYFDFGGYITNINEKNQIYNINKFKDGFRGEVLVYPKNMHFILSPFKNTFYEMLRSVYFTIFR